VFDLDDERYAGYTLFKLVAASKQPSAWERARRAVGTRWPGLVRLVGRTAMRRRLSKLLPTRRRVAKLANRFRASANWANLQGYLMFVGYTRSGHSAVGSLIDAHPNAAVSHELNAVRGYFLGAKREDLFFDIFWRSQEQAEAGRRSPKAGGGSYLHQIAGQGAGSPSDVMVLGDKKGAGTVLQFHMRGLERIEDVRAFVRVPLKIIHVVRNPFDMVAAAIANNEAHREHSFLQLAPIVAEIRERCKGEGWLDVYYEDLIAHPREQLTRILDFLGLPVLEPYLEACEGYLHKTPHKRRFEVQWPMELKVRVQAAIDRYDFLRRYSWEE